jgi:hypothetical protein
MAIAGVSLLSLASCDPNTRDPNAAKGFIVGGVQSELIDPDTDHSIQLGATGSGGTHEAQPGDVFSVSIPFTAPNANVIGAGIRFGDSGPIAVIPVPGAVGQGSGTMVLDVEVPYDICDNLSQICHDIKCYEFAVTGSGTVSAANIQDIALACNDCEEPSCQSLLDSCDGPACDDTVQAGGDTPENHQINMGSSSGTFDFYYDTASQEDRIQVLYQGSTLFDTGCVGAFGTEQIQFSGSSTQITVDITPNCADPQATGTVWEFSVGCPY